MNNRNLGLAALVLLVLSGWTYHDSVTRAVRFERGQKFLQQFDPDAVAEILVHKGAENGEEVRLKRQGDEFVVVGEGGYPATNAAVNNLIRDVLAIGLEKKVGSGEDLEKELGLAGGDERVEVAFVDANGKDLVRFLVGDGGEGGSAASGSYVMRTDGDDRSIYLTESRIYLRTAADDFLKKDILDVPGDQIATIWGADYEIVHEGEAWKLADLPAGKKETTKVADAKNILSGLRFTQHYLADAPEVQGLDFDTKVRVELNDGSWYDLYLARAGEKRYLKVEGGHPAQTEGLSIARDAGDEEVAETADKWKRLEEIEKWNAFQGSWIYEISEWVSDRLGIERKDLLENA